MSDINSIRMAQGLASLVYTEDAGVSTVVDEEAYTKDVKGYTNPNLHRRIESQDDSDSKVQLAVFGQCSYRIINTLDEEIPEIP